MRVIKKDDENFPQSLKNIKNPPRELYVKGDIKCFDLPCVTIVGSRDMSEYGKKMTKKIVKELVEAGVCIVSGLAVGIDTIAHEECLKNGGKTIAVLGSGFNKVFPPENKELFNRIINSGGCVVSEYFPNEEARKIYFPARNRIISGLSLATVVIEATYRSGTSITARFTHEQGKKVFCVPNCVGGKNSSGIINLIKNGATMITDGKEILYSLGIIKQLNNYDELVEQRKLNRAIMLERKQLEGLDEETIKIYDYIKKIGVANVDLMCNELNMSIQNLNIHITILELKGLITPKNNGSYSISDMLYV